MALGISGMTAVVINVPQVLQYLQICICVKPHT